MGLSHLFLRVRHHVQDDFSGWVYGGHALLLALLLIGNYGLGWEDAIMKGPSAWRIPLFFLLNAIALGASCGILMLARRIRLSASFLLMALAGVLVLALDRGFPFTSPIALAISTDLHTYRWVFGLVTSGFSLVTVLLPLLLLSRLPSQRLSHRFGLAPVYIDWRTYGPLFAGVAPVIVLGAWTSSFQAYYPMYQYYRLQVDNQYLQVAGGLLYELVYGLDFINVELLFRGFFVIGLARYIGKESVLPMVTLYCCLHFGKPVGEAISSIFGGYVLGVLALQTRSLWGGIAVHMGVAWLMEASAWLIKSG
ncbi:MAG: CPBP family intramembrane metalloprotease [Cyclobacteriaceae bacterium]|jgi:hypothetical protein|nr:CPBP family intramembrane metalloprotease [Cyclobacteriaceae bacterium]